MFQIPKMRALKLIGPPACKRPPTPPPPTTPTPFVNEEKHFGYKPAPPLGCNLPSNIQRLSLQV